jgi:hypothetical protein
MILRIMIALSVLTMIMSADSMLIAQTNTLQLRNGSNTSTLLPSSTANIILQIPSLPNGTHYIATSTTDPGSSGISITDNTAYGSTSPQSTLAISGTKYLLDVSYSNSLVNAAALGARIASTATGTNSNSTGLTLDATATGTGRGTGLSLSAVSTSGSADALYISAGRLAFLESSGATYTTTISAGNQSANINYTFPLSDGTNGQFLITNGSGSLSWASDLRKLDDYNTVKSGGQDFTGSIFIRLGQDGAANISNANYNTGLGARVFLVITTMSNSIAFGYDAMRYDQTGNDNIAFGSYNVAATTPSRQRSTAIGETAHANANGIEHVLIGRETGWISTSTSQGNTAVGHRNYRNSTSGDYVIALGNDAIYEGGSGSHNIGIGWKSLFGASGSVIAGDYNISMGGNNSLNLTSGFYNTTLGYNSGTGITTGDGNTVLGYSAGDDLTTGSENVMIGYIVGSNSSYDTESNLFLIDNVNTATPLIQGDFTNSSEYLKINGDLQVTGGTTLATGADQAVAGNAVTVDATAYSAVKVTSDNDATADAITITGGSNGMVMYIDFVNTGNNDVTIGGVTHAISDTKSAGITVCRINGTWRVVGIAEY